jgi:hypothetical protein
MLLSEILFQSGYPDVSSSFDREILLAVIEELYPGRLKTIENERKERGRTTRWAITPSKLILNWVYGLDIVIQPVFGKCFAYDVTDQTALVAVKLAKLKESRLLWQRIGVQKVGLILIIPNSANDQFGFLIEDRLDELREMLLDHLIYATDEASSESIRCYTLIL